MANEKVSQMVELSAGEMVSDDLFLIVDYSARESKKLKASALVSFVESSGSFDAYHATEADTASYIDPSVVGLIPSSSYSISSSFASFANTASTIANGTASYAIMAGNVSGSVDDAKTASFLSYNVNRSNGTSSYSVKIKNWECYTKLLSEVEGNSTEFCTVSGVQTKTLFVSLNVLGSRTYCTKTYILTTTLSSPGISLPWSNLSPYDGWFTAKPTVTPHPYEAEQTVYSDYDLELSQSGITDLHFRVRTTKPSTTTIGQSASLSIFCLNGLNTSITFTNNTNTEIVSSNTLPAWGSAFATQQGNYKFVVSGSTISVNGFTGSLVGTSSWANTASYLQDVGSATVQSASHANRADTASYLEATTSYAVNAVSSSFLKYIPAINNGTASYSYAGLYSTTASCVKIEDPTIAKAWAEVVWLTSYLTPTLNSSHNISEFKFLDRHQFGGGAGNTDYYLWGVTFNENLPSTNYTLVGHGQKFLGNPEVETDITIPTNLSDFPKYVNGFTMSMAIDDTYYTSFFVPSEGSANWYGRQTGSVHFMILGT